jgi:sensor histidine kinase YesM
MSPIKNIKTSWIIHIFALLHAVVALCCRLTGLEDELLLTILTMTMALIVCMKQGLNIELTAASIIVVNILGYFIGNLGASLFRTFITQAFAVNAMATFLTTEILGWSIVTLTSLLHARKGQEHSTIDTHYLYSLILAMFGIFALRLSIIVLFSSNGLIEGDVWNAAAKVFSNSFSLITLICLNVLYIRFAKRYFRHWSKASRSLTFIIFMILVSLLESVLAGLEDFPILYATALLAQITVYCIVYMVNYALSAKSQMKEEREKANMAQYRYIKLKHQVNPHFLFNSLNILDCLICEESPERASSYTHKLAGVYRYMLKSEEEMIVSLRDELVFVGLYVDLLKERFPAGFEVVTEVPEELMSRMVLPCSIQLLIENATKHNAVCADNPLTIRIENIGESICVSNNIIPKMTRTPSTGLGQKYIRQMYLDITGKQIEIVETENNYSVTLPLI